MQAYSNPKRENDPYALPDLEVWEDNIATTECRCGNYDVPAEYCEDRETCPSCERNLENPPERTARSGWFYWFCLPGCLPDSGVFGPFETEDEALADAREFAGYEDEDEETED